MAGTNRLGSTEFGGFSQDSGAIPVGKGESGSGHSTRQHCSPESLTILLPLEGKIVQTLHSRL